MQWIQFCGPAPVDIPESEHVFKSFLTPGLEPAPSVELVWITESAEKDIPDREVREVARVMLKLMVNTMGFRALHEKSEPMRCFHIPVVKIFGHRA